MRPKLIFITGAPAVGKTAVAQRLFAHLTRVAWLEGDDVWRTNPFRVDEVTTAMVENNIRFILRAYLTSDFPYVILSWVLHDQAIIDRILDGLKGLEYELFIFTLICDEATLAARWSDDARRGPITDLALERLRQSKSLKSVKMDTADREPEEIACEIARILEGDSQNV